jgi:hypothetical protein
MKWIPCLHCGNEHLRLLGNPLCAIYGEKMADVYCEKCQAQAPQKTWNKRYDKQDDKQEKPQMYKANTNLMGDHLIGKQKDLPEEFSKVLHENLEDLYATSENVINEG